MGLWVVAAGAGALRGASQWEGREGKRRGLRDAPEEETLSRSQQPTTEQRRWKTNRPTVLFSRRRRSRLGVGREKDKDSPCLLASRP